MNSMPLRRALGVGSKDTPVPVTQKFMAAGGMVLGDGVTDMPSATDRESPLIRAPSAARH